MNKYQEALDRVKTAPNFVGGNREYKAQLDSYDLFEKDISLLQKLVDKEKGVKPEYVKSWDSQNTFVKVHYCPICKEIPNPSCESVKEKVWLNKFVHKYCFVCGTKIDWSDEE